MESLRAEKQYRIGLIGDKHSLAPFWELFASLGNERMLRRMGFEALALREESADHGGFGGTMELPVHANWRDMLAAHPGLNLVIETTGDPVLLAELRQGLPLYVSLVERGAASFFVRLLSTDQMWMACKVDLLHTQTLLKGIIDQLKEEIVLADAEGRVIDCNRAVELATGLSKADMAGKPLRQFFRIDPARTGPPGRHDRPPLERALASRQAAEDTLAHVDDAGRLHYTREYVYPLNADTESGVSFLCIRRDITGRTEMEQRLQQSERLASIGELSTYIAHEIRNPLFAIGGFANQLLRFVAEPAAREKIEIIIEEAKRLDGILKSILTFARPLDPGHRGLADVNRIVRETMELMGMACESKGIQLELALGEHLPLAEADPELVKQCLINLVKNSVEAMHGGGRLTVRTAVDGARVLLEVKDTGHGIAPELRDKVFSPFFSTKGKGSGLGLAMTKKIMDELRGEVELSSLPGQGTRVTLGLPPQLAVAKPQTDG